MLKKTNSKLIDRLIILSSSKNILNRQLTFFIMFLKIWFIKLDQLMSVKLINFSNNYYNKTAMIIINF